MHSLIPWYTIKFSVNIYFGHRVYWKGWDKFWRKNLIFIILIFLILSKYKREFFINITWKHKFKKCKILLHNWFQLITLWLTSTFFIFSVSLYSIMLSISPLRSDWNWAWVQSVCQYFFSYFRILLFHY